MSDLEHMLAETVVELAKPKLEPASALQHTLSTQVDEPTRTIYLGDIDGGTGEWFSIVLNYFNSLSDKPVNLILNSPGGDVVSMFVIHDAIRSSKAPVHVHGTGWVASAAVLLLAAGHKRTVSESCCLMSHAGSTGSNEGDYRAVKDRRQWEDWNQTHWCELMGRYTPGKDAKWWAKTTANKAEWWLLGGAAIVEAKLADEVV